VSTTGGVTSSADAGAAALSAWALAAYAALVALAARIRAIARFIE
jgi:hypothetical protein